MAKGTLIDYIDVIINFYEHISLTIFGTHLKEEYTVPNLKTLNSTMGHVFFIEV